MSAVYEEIKRKAQSRTIPLDLSDPASHVPVPPGTA